MRSSPLTRVGFGLSLTVLTSALVVFGCDDDGASAGGPTIGVEGGVLDGSAASDAADPAKDAAGGDAANDPGSLSAEPGIYLANMWGAPIDFCFRPPGESAFTGPVFQAQGGVPADAVSVRTSVPVESFVVLITGGATCSDTPIFTGGTVTTAGTPLLVLVVRNGSIEDARPVYLRPEDHVAGKDNLYYGRQARDARFVPAGGGAPTAIADDAPTPLDPGLTGALELEIPANTATREVKTAVGVSLLLDAPHPETTPLLCDLLAPEAGHLLACSAAVRAP